MYTFMVEYTEDNGATLKTILINAIDQTKAYLNACYALPIVAIITEVFKI